MEQSRNVTQYRRQQIESILKSPLISQYTTENIINKLTQKHLVMLEQTMKQYPTFSITDFLRFFMKLLQPIPEHEIYVLYGLFKTFKDLCKAHKTTDVNFKQISTMITDRMPITSDEVRIKEKLLPINLDIPQVIKNQLLPPDVEGKVIQQRIRLNTELALADNLHHLNRRIAQAVYSTKLGYFFLIDAAAFQINVIDNNFNEVRVLRTELQISKRDSTISSIAWSETEQRIACLLGNLSISLWAKDDDFRFEVNVPIPTQYLVQPYISIHYMQSSRKWFCINDRPSIYILSSYNFQPETIFKHSKLQKKKPTEKSLVCELKYRKLICLAFEKSLFLISLQKKEIVAELSHFRTAITSIVFSESYQALFVSTYQSYFTSYQLTEHLDLNQKGVFPGHKHTICVLGVLENKPVVYSLQQSSVLKLWDIRDLQSYQSFSVLKNISYQQILAMSDSICLVGSKMYQYKWISQDKYRDPQKVLLLAALPKQLILVTNRVMRLHNHHTGALNKIFRGIFGLADIYSAYLLEQRNRLFISDEQGNLLVYDITDFSIVQKRKIDPHPSFFQYDQNYEILSYCCLGTIFLAQYIDDENVSIRRKILNKKSYVTFLKGSSSHDLIAVTYNGDENLYFYSYEKCKPLGYFAVNQFITLHFLEGYSIILVLTKQQLFFYSFRRGFSAATFFELKALPLWDKNKLLKLQTPQYLINLLKGFGMIVMDSKVYIYSDCAGVYSQLDIGTRLKIDPLPKYRETFNPYRVSTQDHNQCFSTLMKAVILKQPLKYNFDFNYFYLKNKKQTKCFDRLQDFLYICDSAGDIFVILPPCFTAGCLNLQFTLPKYWNVYYYTQKDIKELEFVLSFYQNQKSYKNNTEDSTTTQLRDLNFNRQPSNITIVSLLQEDRQRNEQVRGYKSCSLRQKKTVLQKQRDEKQKMQNFTQFSKNQQQQKAKNNNRKTSQRQINETLFYFSANYHEILMKKGITETEDLPAVKNFQRKLNNVVMKDEKKSIVSKVSKFSKEKSEEVGKYYDYQDMVLNKVKSVLQLVSKDSRTKKDFENPRNLMKKLNLQLRQSKNKNPNLSDRRSLRSLPPLLKSVRD